MSVSGVAYYEWEFDQKGNVTAERSMGTNGSLPQGNMRSDTNMTDATT